MNTQPKNLFHPGELPMILRRVIHHFRNQEWTAITLDFLIVVVGVFIGIQVANWNTLRSERAQLDQQLLSLESEHQEESGSAGFGSGKLTPLNLMDTMDSFSRYNLG